MGSRGSAEGFGGAATFFLMVVTVTAGTDGLAFLVWVECVLGLEAAEAAEEAGLEEEEEEAAALPPKKLIMAHAVASGDAWMETQRWCERRRAESRRWDPPRRMSGDVRE